MDLKYVVAIVATEVVWDDVDIVHVVRDTIEIPNQYIYGGNAIAKRFAWQLGSQVLPIRLAFYQHKMEQRLSNETLVSLPAVRCCPQLRSLFDIPDRMAVAYRSSEQRTIRRLNGIEPTIRSAPGFTPLGVQAVDTDNNGVGQRRVPVALQYRSQVQPCRSVLLTVCRMKTVLTNDDRQRCAGQRIRPLHAE